MADRRDHPPPRYDDDPRGGLRFFFVFLFRLSLNGFASVLNTYAGQRIVFAIRLELLRHLERLPSSFHRKTAPGELLHRMENDVQVVEELGGTLLMSVVRIAVTSLLTVAVMLLLDWKLTLLAMPLLAVTFWIRRYGQPRLRNLSDDVQKAGAERMAFLQELFTSILQVQLLRRETAEARRFVALSRRNLDLQVRRRGGELLLGMACILAMAAGTAVVLGFGGYQVVAGVLTIGGLVAFYTFLSRLFEPIENITAMYSQYQRAAASVRRVQQLLDLAPSIRDAPHALPLPSDTRGAVELRGVTFRYENQRPILRDVDLRVEPGERLAVIGPTGSGKSTLAGLLTRAYDPDEGEVRIGGFELRRLRLRDVRAAVAVVPQEPLLFDTTLRENLRYGNRHATARDLEEALHLAQLDEMVSRLPDGIEQRIGPRGGLLSGGERQRVAIARAILQRPAVLVLDEATSALDGPTEKRLLAGLGTFTRERTTIVIAHRLAPILWADRTLFLDDGAVVAAGPHRELHLSCVRYRNFLDDQLRREGTEEAA